MADPASLAARLRRIQQAQPREATPPAVGGLDAPPGPGWERAARLLWVRETEAANPLAADRPLRLLTAGVADDRDLAFIDTETTGLSGGAGTIAFLVGVGRPEGERFRVIQFFVADYPGEAALIEALSEELTERSVVVSYNGKSFDVPILRSRFALNGRRLSLGAQIDLLHTARRLWRGSIGSCSLAAIEERVLEIGREEDVPGYLVPELYFDYLRSGDGSALGPVFSHHLYDILSLASLLARIESMDPSPTIGGGVDAVELARIMLERGMPGGEALLRECALSGSLAAARTVSLHFKRLARWEEAVEIWSSLWERSKSYFAGIELAKFYEHRLHDYAKALEVVERISTLPLRGTPWAAAARGDAVRRRERLIRKAGGKTVR